MPRWTKTLEERIMDRVEHSESCWLWTGALDRDGYGRIQYAGQCHMAHRVVFSTFKGHIDVGLEIDHICRVRRCVNPEHLEVVSRAENNRRRWAYAHCKNATEAAR